MKKILFVAFLLSVVSCGGNKPEDPLLLPPNFDEMPDPNKSEEKTKEQEQENVDRLKELLLKSD